MTLLQDILDDDLKVDNRRLVVRQLYQSYFDSDTSHIAARLRTPKNAVSKLQDVYSLIGRAISDYETRAGTPSTETVTFTEETPDKKFNPEVISISCISSIPGAFSQGAPMEGKIKNLRFIPRESVDDPDHPGYRVAMLGYELDNLLRLTCWARTNKAANRRADWFQDLMFEYDWWFCAEGINRIIFMGRREDKVLEKDGVKWYGRPLDYFVRCEKIKMRSERAIEEILVNLTLSAG